MKRRVKTKVDRVEQVQHSTLYCDLLIPKKPTPQPQITLEKIKTSNTWSNSNLGYFDLDSQLFTLPILPVRVTHTGLDRHVPFRAVCLEGDWLLLALVGSAIVADGLGQTAWLI